MTETTTPTEEVVESSAGSVQTDLPADSTTNSAVESVDDTASEESTDSSSNDSTTENGEDEQDTVSADLKRFAKSQGYTDEDLTDLSPREAKALRIAQKQVSETRKKMQAESQEAIEKTVTSVKGSDMSDRDYFEFRMAQRDMVDNIRDYWKDNPDDVAYQAQAIAILEKEKADFGEDAMLRLAGNMPRLVREAKFSAGAFDTSAATEKGRKEERERLNRIQQGAADGMDARTTETAKTSEINSDWVKNTYDPSNEEHRKQLDTFLNSGGKVY